MPGFSQALTIRFHQNDLSTAAVNGPGMLNFKTNCLKALLGKLKLFSAFETSRSKN